VSLPLFGLTAGQRVAAMPLEGSMAKKRKARDYHEPWSLTQSQSWRLSYKTPPSVAETPEDLRIAVADWEASRDKAEKNADWIIWGSRLSEPAVVPTLLGNYVYADDRRILTFSRLLGLPDGSPTHEEFASRVIECVNAMTGIADPVMFIQELTALLTDMANDPIDEFFGGRAARLLFKIIEHKELVESHAQEQYDPE
jgi:hypothetical protein